VHMHPPRRLYDEGRFLQALATECEELHGKVNHKTQPIIPKIDPDTLNPKP